MRSRSNGGVIGAYALPNQNRANGVFFIHDAAIYNTGANPIWPLGTGYIYSATGGTISTALDNSNYKIHTFTANGTFTVTTGSAYIDIFLVGGGGSGGAAYQPVTSTTAAGGGGAGGVVLLAQNVWVNGGTTFTVEVGLGGSMLNGVIVDSKPSRVTSGSGYSYLAAGGGYGGGRRSSALSEATSGGGGYNISVTQSGQGLGGAAPAAGTGSPGTITSNTYDGGSAIGLQVANKLLGGGGSGATGPGYSNNYSFNPAKAGNGGDGYYYPRTGYYYGGGGGGGVLGTAWSTNSDYYNVGCGGLVYDGTGWANGGRTTNSGTSAAGSNSVDGYGGGGGGAVQYATTNSTNQAGIGGSGTVIFSYRYR